MGQRASTPVDLAVVILTFNEEVNLGAALDSVKGWAREVFVVDSNSTDGTVDLALARAADGVRVVQHAFESYSAQWNWALTRLPISSAWTLKLDADERVTGDLRTELQERLAAADEDVGGFFVRYHLFFMGRALRWGGYSGTYLLRVWRTGKAAFEDREVNEHALVGSRTERLRSFFEHRDHKTLTDWLDKQNRYTSMEARSALEGNLTGGVKPRLFGTPDQRRMWLKRLHAHVPGCHLLYFLYLYVLRLGCLDGHAGFRLAFLRANVFYWIDLKKLEGGVPVVVWPRRGRPHPEVAGSELQRRVDRG